jgi:hypothetical protein
VRPDRHVDVLLTLRRNASPRIRRIVAAILASIRRGHPPETAIRLAAKRFGLPSGRVRACLADHVGFHLEGQDLCPWAVGDVTSVGLIHEWI